MSILISKYFVYFSAPSLFDCAPPLQLVWPRTASDPDLDQNQNHVNLQKTCNEKENESAAYTIADDNIYAAKKTMLHFDSYDNKSITFSKWCSFCFRENAKTLSLTLTGIQ